MATHDYVIANASGAAVRADLNNALAAIASNNSNSTDPATTFAHQWYVDTGDDTLKLRNAANDGYTNVSAVGGIGTANLGLALAASPTFTGDVVINSTSALQLPSGTTAQRPTSPTNGDIRYNSTISEFEGYANSAWTSIGGRLVGEIIAYPNATIPDGWLECNGQSTSGYSALAAVCGANVPDLRGEFIRGFDNSKGTDSGRTLLSAQAAAFASHTHTLTDPGHFHSETRASSRTVSDGGVSGAFVASTQSVNTGTSTTGITIASTGGTETRPRNIALIYIIKT